MKQISFTKMHGLGNDFVIIDSRNNSFMPTPDLAKKIADRQKGIGADGIIIISSSKNEDTDCFMTIINSDGSFAEACGNASRCVTRLMIEETEKETILIETAAGIITGQKKENLFAINMGKASFEPSDIPLTYDADTTNMPVLTPEIENSTALSMGNPHLVCFIDDIAKISVSQIGSKLENNPIFKYKTNVEFIQIIDRKTIRMRVWERGAGITMACGTGACASFAATLKKDLCDKKVEVILDGGSVFIELLENEAILMTGSANKVFSGKLNIDEI